ncbi:MAG TPA: MltA domain-containing protein [bacterium]|nr:MltA domain-containing protein [bacterium]
MLRRKLLLLIVLLTTAWPALAGPPPVVRDDGDVRSLLLALDRQEKYLLKRAKHSLRLQGRRVSGQRALNTVRHLRKLTLAYHGKPEFAQRLSSDFEIVTVSTPAVFTGYHTPLLNMRPTKGGAFTVPVLGRPRDLFESKGKVFRRVNGQLTAAPTRAQIYDGAYNLDRLAIGYTDNLSEYYYAQIQGGALAVQADGSRKTLIFAGHNGYPFVSVERDIMKEVPAAQRPGGYFGLRRFLAANPETAMRFFRRNPRFIFFKFSDTPPMGMTGLPLTPLRAIATDKAYYGAGLVGLISYREAYKTPAGDIAYRQATRLVCDADTGAAIKGPGRVDLYFGEGALTDLFVTGFKETGTLAYLLVKE